jgi:uncharacterized protein (DUF362 family)
MIAVKKVEQQSIDEAIAALLKEVRFTPEKGKGIFIKPNVVIGTGDSSIITSVEVVESLLRYFSGYKLIIGERSAVGIDTYKALERSGYVELAHKYGVEIVDLSKVPRVNVEWERGILKLPQVLFENHYINVAKLKTHFLTTVSLCAKNQKGLLSVKDAKKFHFTGIDRAICALGKAVKPDLNIIDGIKALEGNGPTTFGRAKKMGVLIAGNDLFQVDSVACKLMGIEPGEVKHLMPQEIPGDLTDAINAFSSPFLKPSLENCLTVEHVHFHNIRNCCSGCILAIDNGINWLMSEKKELWLKLLKKLSSETYNIYLGTGNHLDMETAPANVRAFGGCSVHFARCNNLPYINGCPPSYEEVIALFELN